MNEAVKKCTKCHELKSLDKFNKRTSAHDGLQSWCRACNIEYGHAKLINDALDVCDSIEIATTATNVAVYDPSVTAEGGSFDLILPPDPTDVQIDMTKGINKLFSKKYQEVAPILIELKLITDTGLNQHNYAPTDETKEFFVVSDGRGTAWKWKSDDHINTFRTNYGDDIQKKYREQEALKFADDVFVHIKGVMLPKLAEGDSDIDRDYVLHTIQKTAKKLRGKDHE